MTTPATQYTKLGLVVLAEDVAGASAFYEQYLGFVPVVRLDWYASHQHPQRPDVYLDVLQRGHPSAGRLGSERTTGVLLALETADCAAEHRRLEDAGLTMAGPPTDEPWGQRRFQFDAPGGVVVEIVQPIEPDPEWVAAAGL